MRRSSCTGKNDERAQAQELRGEGKILGQRWTPKNAGENKSVSRLIGVHLGLNRFFHGFSRPGLRVFRPLRALPKGEARTKAPAVRHFNGNDVASRAEAGGAHLVDPVAVRELEEKAMVAGLACIQIQGL